MKILIATGIYPPDIGGPATYSRLLREQLPERGIGVKILSFGEVRYLPKIVRHIIYFGKIVSRCRGYDLIYAQDPVSVGFPALLAARIMGKKFFIRVAGDYAWEQAVQRYGIKDSIDDFQSKRYGLKTGFLRSIQKFVVGHADMVFTPSIYFKNLVSGWNKGQKNVNPIYNGIEFPELTKSKSEARTALQIPADGKVIVSAGRLVPWKGFGALIDVAKKLVESDRNYKLYILGTGPDKETLASRIKDLDLNENVILTGAVSREEVFSYLVAADVFVLNTSFESFSFQIVEAMYAGVPVVSTNIGNISEIVKHGYDGILVTPDDREAIRKAIDHLISNRKEADLTIERAREKAKTFSIQSTLDNLCKFLNK